ncbi:MAG TPA: protocatechuate 3,4-dioxygenase subunit alpha [Parafilimonas sp.]|nr:protocatechuate 3,4-dioxygenase subunit alpha [Parafilimonas sp.]
MTEKRIRRTPSQTIGPFFAYSLAAEQYGYAYNSIVNGTLLDPAEEGELIYVTGNVFDGKGNSIPDALIELWQADANATYRTLPVSKKNDGFTGFGRLGTGTHATHKFSFVTIKPGGTTELQAPHINVILFMRGSLLPLYTRIYFSDEKEANSKDELLNAIGPARRKTLIAQRIEKPGLIEYIFDVYMQGENETVFFEVEK